MASLKPVSKVILGRKHGVVQWVASGYWDFVQRDQPPSEAEKEVLGLQVSLKIFEIREKRWAQFRMQNWTVQSRGGLIGFNAVKEAFKDELTPWTEMEPRIFSLPFLKRALMICIKRRNSTSK